MFGDRLFQTAFQNQHKLDTIVPNSDQWVLARKCKCRIYFVRILMLRTI